MNEVSIIGIDLAKRVFQLHGAAADGSVVFRKKLTRAQLLPFLASQPAAIVAMEACGTAHHWGREAARLGHTITLLTAGRVVQQGTYADLAERPASPFVTQFLTAQAAPTPGA